MTQLFLASAADYVLKDILKKLPQTPDKYHVAFIPTASEVEEGDHWWIMNDKNALIKAGFNVEEFSITGLSELEVEEKLKNKNLIFVAGGNTFYLLDKAIKSGFDKVLKKKIKDGVVYIGSSAGSCLVGVGNFLSKSIDDLSKAPGLKSDGLGIVDFVILPHWGSTDFRDGYQKSFADLYLENYKILPLTNTQYLYVNGDNTEIIDTSDKKPLP